MQPQPEHKASPLVGLNRFYHQVGCDPKVVIIAGIGYAEELQMMRDLWPRARFFGFEPHPELVERFSERFPGRVFPFALDSECRLRKLIVNSHTDTRSSFYPYTEQDPNPKTIEVQCKTLDWLRSHVDNIKWERVLIWLDVQGAELVALQGGSKLLATDAVRWLNVECNLCPARNYPPWWEIDSFLRMTGYRCMGIHSLQQNNAEFDAIYVKTSKWETVRKYRAKRAVDRQIERRAGQSERQTRKTRNSQRRARKKNRK